MQAKKVINMSVDDATLDSVIAQLQAMKKNNNKIVKIGDPGSSIAIVINHVHMEKPE